MRGALLVIALLGLACDNPDDRLTTGDRCVDLSECAPIEACNCGDGPQTYQVCFASRCAKDCSEACRTLSRL